MPTVHVEAQLSSEDLVQAINQLDSSDLEVILEHVLELHAERKATRVPAVESLLLQQINAGLPSDLRTRYNQLLALRDAETLTTDQHQELLDLSDQVELWEAARMEKVIELANLRHLPVNDVLSSLSIGTLSRVA